MADAVASDIEKVLDLVTAACATGYDGCAGRRPIAFDDLSPAYQGSTANLTLTFNAITVEGSQITGVSFRTLLIEQCA